MEVNKGRYEEVIQKIHTARISFYNKYGIEPNAVMLNEKDFYTLRDTNYYMINLQPDENAMHTVMGMSIKLSKTDKVSVGLMVDIE